jgi:hypothetical protein
MREVRARHLIPLALVAALLGSMPAFAQKNFDFMPTSGKSLFVEVFGAKPDAATLDEMTAAARSEAQWSGVLAERNTDLSDKGLRTLAAYLAVNMPLPRDALDAAAKAGDIATALPADGRELAWTGCQSCHSLFTGYLTQDRNLQGWQNMFQSPFHRELKMTPQQRDEFSRYSTINMPMKFEDVPEDLRF